MKTKINFKNKHLTKLFVVATLSSVLVVFNQCVVQQYEEEGTAIVDHSDFLPVNDAEQAVLPVVEGGVGEFIDTGATEAARTPTIVGVKDFEQVNKTFSVLTGIPINNGQVNGEFLRIATQLANDNDVKKFATATEMATVKLAGSYCDEMMDNAAARDSIGFAGIATRPDQSLDTNAEREELIGLMMTKFWGQGTQDGAEWNANMDDLKILLNDLLQGESQTSGNTTRLVAKGLCTAMLASPRALLL
jgi:hypothetical protein